MGEKATMTFYDAIKIGERIWFSSGDFNGLFSFDLQSNMLLFHGEFPGELSYEERLYDSLVESANKIYFIPNKAKQIAVYDLEKEEFSKINIAEQYIHERMSFFTAAQYKEFIFAFGIYVPVILCLDTRNHSIRYITSWYQEIKKDIFDEKEIFFGKRAIVIENRILIPMCNANCILELNGDTLEYKAYPIGNGNIGYYGIDYDGKDIWCSPRLKGNPVIRLDKQVELKKEYSIYSERFQSYVAGVSCLGNKLQIYPVENVLGTNYPSEIDVVEGAFAFVRSSDSQIISFEKDKKELRLYDKKNKQLVCKKIMTDEKYYHFPDEISARVVNEKKGKDLRRMMKWLAEESIDKKTEDAKRVGDVIYISLAE